MKLKTIYATAEEIPEKYRELYEERNGQWELTGIEGVRTQGDVDRLQSALRKERDDHSATRSQLREFDGLKPDEVRSQLDRIPELEAAAQGKLDDTKVNEIVETRLRSRIAPIERERDQLKEKVGEFENEITTYKTANKQRSISDSIRSAATKSKVLPEAIEDALVYGERMFEIDEDGNVVTRDGVGVTPGIGAEAWLTEMQGKRPHWWGPSMGGGARPGSGRNSGPNPWSKEHWNITEQNRIYRANPKQASDMAQSAGTSIGGLPPEK